MQSILERQNKAPIMTAPQLPTSSHISATQDSFSHMEGQDYVLCSQKEKPKTDHDGKSYVELVPGYDVRIIIPQLDSCLRKAKESGTAQARLLPCVYFSDETLAQSLVPGTKSKPALDLNIIEAIIKYVSEKRTQSSEKDVVQAINQKCADA